MMLRKVYPVCCLLLLSSTLFGLKAAAQTGFDTSQQLPRILLAQSSENNEGIDAGAAASIAKAATGGRVLSVGRLKKKGKNLFRVKILMPDGRVRMIRINADTGSIIE